MKLLKSVLVSGLLALCACAWAQQETYRIQSEDILHILVYNQSDLVAQVIVSPDGNITAPFVGMVHAEGKTTTELEAELTELYKAKLGIKDPIVSVVIDAYRRIHATITGQMTLPGSYEMRPGDSILTLYTRGGGQLRDNSADLRRAFLRRKGSNELIPVDLFAMLTKGDMSQNYEVKDGDELVVPEETVNRVLVLGRVPNPGVYPYKEPMTLMDAIALGRGEIEFRSKLSAVRVIRQVPGRPGEFMQIEANLVRYIKNGDSAQNVKLQAGDLVYVPDSGNINFNQVSSIANILFILDRFGFKLTPLGGF